MPNYCSYEMKVQGKPENVEEFKNILKADYDYNEQIPEHKHFSRVFDVTMYEDITENGVRSVEFYGSCAWSVYSCMMDGEHTYYEDFKKEYGNSCMATTLEIESKRLGLAIQVYSEEAGMGFQEHYVCINGETIVDDCVDWEENYIDDEETLEEYNKEHGTSYTMADVEDNDYSFPEGGYEEWKFEDYSNKIVLNRGELE